MNNTKVYQAGLKFLFERAVDKCIGGEVIFHHSLDKGIYASIISKEKVTEDIIMKIKESMNQMIEESIPFHKKVVEKREAYEFFRKKGQMEKAYNVLNISNLTVSLFEFDGKYNYFYTHEMPMSSKELSLYDLYHVNENEVVLLYPTNDEITFVFRKKIYESFANYDKWLNALNLNYVHDVNEIIASGNVADLIRKNDIMMDNKLYDMAKEIVKRGKKIVLLAGPSSSGKTTSSKKLSLYLESFGYHAMPLSLDDFFVERVNNPLDEEGNYDYECLEALDLTLFKNTLSSLLKGEKVKLPMFDFISGEKEFCEEETQLDAKDILVIEGLHALNPALMPDELKNDFYKIYVSPLTPLNVDRHNYISTTDNRLLRRIVRDFRTRGRSVEESLASWGSVRRGEELYIFPYTDTCDEILNTAYVYEIGVLKVYVEPLLYSVPLESEYYNEARRLLDSLKTFYAIPSEYVSRDNLLREFIGGSSFEER